jgi:23S rRNA (adenine2503-C2)-methyltransferase
MPELKVAQNPGPAFDDPLHLGSSLDALIEVVQGLGRAKTLARILAGGGGLDALAPLGARWRTRIAERGLLPPLEAGEAQRAADGTTKFLIHLEDGEAVESVLIPSGERTTLCVSSQVGCARACDFCRTGMMGLLRNLNAREILSQVFQGRRLAEDLGMPPLRNLVFMGMGEPLDNLKAVQRATENLIHPSFFGWSPRHITLSTVGSSPERIRSLARFPGRLAWSVHAADDVLRRRLVPTTRHTMMELAEAFVDAFENRSDSLFVEMALMDGLNDSPEHARQLVELLAPLPGKVRVNLLPMNPIPERAFRPSTADAVAAFADEIRGAELICTLRRARGDEKNAACGQLATARRAQSNPRASRSSSS